MHFSALLHSYNSHEGCHTYFFQARIARIVRSPRTMVWNQPSGPIGDGDHLFGEHSRELASSMTGPRGLLVLGFGSSAALDAPAGCSYTLGVGD